MADTKLSALTELAATPAIDDEVYIRDVSEAAADESKRITIANLLGVGALGASAWVVANDAQAKIKAFAQILQSLDYPVWVCDGTADDVEIQAAIDATVATGGKVVLSEGNFSISSAITVPANTTIEGTSRGLDLGTLLKMTNSSNCNMFEWIEEPVTTYYRTIKNLILHGNADGVMASGDIIHFEHAYFTTVENCWIRRAKDRCIYLEVSEGSRIFNCIISDAGKENVLIYGGGANDTILNCEIGIAGTTNVYFQASGRSRIAFCHLHSAVLYGVRIRESEGLIIIGNKILVNENCGVFIEGSTRCVIQSNTLEGNCTGSGDSAIFLTSTVGHPVIDTVISGNIAYDDEGAPTQLNLLREYGDVDYTILAGNNQRGSPGNIIVGVNDRVYEQHSDLFMDVLAVSATAIRSNEDLSEAIPNTFTLDAQPDVPRTLSGHFDAHAQITAYTIVITGVDAKGNVVTETFTEAASPWDFETSNAFATITSIIMTTRTGTGAGDTMDIGITDVLGLSNVIYATGDVYKIKKNNANAVVAGAQVNVTYNTYDMAVIGLAATDDFTIWFRSNLNIVN